MAANKTYEFDVKDVEYLRHGDKPLLARIFQPRGKGPFPGMIELHGGAWCNNDRTMDKTINETLSKSGVVVAALDFRMPPDAGYPGAMADINYGIRWLKAHADEYGTRADLVGISGNSSGAHQAMLVGMRPRDPRYSAACRIAERRRDRAMRHNVLARDRSPWPVSLCKAAAGGSQALSADSGPRDPLS